MKKEADYDANVINQYLKYKQGNDRICPDTGEFNERTPLIVFVHEPPEGMLPA